MWIMNEAYIVAALRTAGGKKGGRLKDWHPADLGGFMIDALLDQSRVDPLLIEDAIFGCVNQVAEQAANIGRQSVLASKLPERVPGTTIDRQCGSSQQALHFAAQAVLSGAMDVVIAGGIESMTRVPMGLNTLFLSQHGYGQYKGPRVSARYPEVATFSQFSGAEMMVSKYGLDKVSLDQFSLESHRKAADATNANRFAAEIVAVPIINATGKKELHERDEGIRFDASLTTIAGVKRLSEAGVLTAANASQVCDGASGVIVVNERGLKEVGLAPLARIHQMTVLGGDPVMMLETPIEATRVALKKAGMAIADIDLFEVNEAFASIPLAWLKTLDADPGKLNVNGGAIALGHPLGASGTKLMATLIHELRARGARYGLQTMCEGGGLANVTIIERL
jgi:acetyl-CoA C-acetyltransferase